MMSADGETRIPISTTSSETSLTPQVLSRHTALHTNGWTPELESLLVAWAEKASGYAWLHNRSIALFKHRNLFLTIPAALFAYMAAATTLMAAEESENSWRTVVAGLGSLVSGMLINFQELFTFKELSEQHRLSQLGFLAFFRDISCELSVPKAQRKEASEYVTLKRLEMDKLLEHAPDIPPRIVASFDERFAEVKMHKPDVVSRLQTVIPHLSPLPPGSENTSSRRRPIQLDFRPGRDIVVPWEARTTVPNLVEIANSDSSSDHEGVGPPTHHSASDDSDSDSGDDGDIGPPPTGSVPPDQGNSPRTEEIHGSSGGSRALRRLHSEV
jgi:hypothetical protein